MKIDCIPCSPPITNSELVLSTEGHSSGVTSVAFAPDGNTIATASSDNTAIVWDAAKASMIRRIKKLPYGFIVLNSKDEPILLSKKAWAYLHTVYKDASGNLTIGSADLHPSWHDERAIEYQE